ncbi:MAG: ATP-dependent DNA helicase RecG [Bacillota bacterium]|nr:ATP-dependent DNA helicase RecG [Bacillota bacterium]
MSNLDLQIIKIKGVGSAIEKKLERLGITTVSDMLYYFPYRIEDRSEIKKIAELQEGETACIKAAVFSAVSERRVRKNMVIYNLTLRDDSGFINAIWYNNKYVVNTFKIGNFYTFYGQIKRSAGKKDIINPVYEKADVNIATGRIIPVYQLTSGLSLKALLGIASKCLDLAENDLEETLPKWVRDECELCEIKYAIRNIHFPASFHDYSVARKRLVFEEFLLLNMGMRALKDRRNNLSGYSFNSTDLSAFYAKLPFTMTDAQLRVCNEISMDLTLKKPMNRLVQGDVGCGKTAVAAACLYLACQNGYQGAMMAPTELLASQHYESLKSMLPGIKIALLSGSTKTKERRMIIEGLKSGEIQVAVGTHALFSKDVEFNNLALVITDEQHRFGVRQRALLAEKASLSPHVLVMTATPIPRTLALILYSDLNISVIDQMPPGRQKVDTYVVDENMRHRIYSFIDKIVKQGNQAYIVCPMVEENDASELKSVVEFTENLKKYVFVDLPIGFIHGKMKSDEKDSIMESFIKNEITVLVSTTVIEVGVNVPNATLMVVENAERFGLSQLHQLRGRVGRGKDKSYCVLFNQSDSKITKERMDIMASTNDGFLIANKDLELRGPGEIFGTKQHGLPELKIGDIAKDTALLNLASNISDRILKDDPLLQSPDHRCLKESLKKMFIGRGAESMFN